MPTYYIFSQDLAHKVHNLSTDQLKFALSNSSTTTDRTKTVIADITQITSLGYPAGGYNVTVLSSGLNTTNNKYELKVQAITINPTSGDVGPFRYGVLYNSVNNKLIEYVDYGVEITIPQNQTGTLSFTNDIAVTIQASDQP